MSSKNHHRVLLALAGLTAVGMAIRFAPRGATAGPSDPFADLPPTLSLDAIIRDFKAAGDPGGHPDFESYGNPYITTGLVQPTLDADAKPVFAAQRGDMIKSDFHNADGSLIINPSMANASLGDQMGVLEPVASDQLTSASDFAQWYRDTQGVNLSKRIPLTFNRVAGTNRYVFDSAVDEPYASRGGFFPIDGELSGNFGTSGHNFHFTTEISTIFLFERGKNHVFTFTGDDDVWVFIDDTLVLDLGGLHPKREQSLELNRLDWLTDGEVHKLRVFHAERHTTASNFRIETSLQLKKVEPPPVSGLYD